MLDGYEKRSFTGPLSAGAETSHDVYTKGAGPVVVLIQELPGIGPEMLALADLFERDGFTVVMPHLFGPLGRTSLAGNMVRVLCMRRAFHVLARNGSSPMVNWLRALCRDARDRHGVPGVAVIGMCLTGNFAISLMADDAVLAAMASQPAMPFFGQSALHMSPEDIGNARAGLDRKGPMRAYRYDRDPLCTAAKFAAIYSAFNDDGTERVRTHVLPGKGHSVLTLDFLDRATGQPRHNAYDEVRDYFRGALNA